MLILLGEEVYDEVSQYKNIVFLVFILVSKIFLVLVWLITE